MLKKLRYIFLVTAGTGLLAFAIDVFAMPNNLIFGGAAGLSLIISHYIHMDMAVITGFLNVIFLIMAYFMVNKELMIGSVLSSVLYPILLGMFENIPALTEVCKDPMLASVIGGLCGGAGIGMVMLAGASSGGTDILCVVMHKYMHMSVGTALNLTDGIIMLSQLLFNPADRIFYGIIYTLCTSHMIDWVMMSGNQKVRVTVISSHYEEIRKALLKADIGVTMYQIVTGLDQKHELACETIINKKNLSKVQRIIKEADPSSFSSVEEINEVHGRGFTLAKYTKPLDL